MVQISFYENGTGKFIKQWPNWTGEVPAVGDMVLLHFGDVNEEECENIVKLRVIDGTRPEYVKIFIEEIRRIKQPTDEEIEDLEVSILKSVEEEGEDEPILCAIEDDAELEAVYNLIMQQLYEDEDEE